MPNPTEELIGQFIDAVVNDQVKAQQLLSAEPALLNALWIHKETVLHFLAVEGYSDAVRCLAIWGADIDPTNEFGDTPLIDVATLGNDEIAQILIDFGANVNATSKTRHCVLFCAIQSRNERLIDLLLSAGASASYKSDIGHTVFDEVPTEEPSRTAILNILQKYGAAPNQD